MTPLQFERRVRADLRARRWLRWHAMLIATFTLMVAGACSLSLKAAGLHSLGLRYGIAFAVAYAALMGLLCLWGRWLLSRDEGSGDPGLDFGGGSGGSGKSDPVCDGAIRSGEGGDFGGGGGGGSFELPDGAGDAVGTVAEAAGALDEGVVVLVPLALLVLVAAALGAVLGFAVFGLFGVEVLLGVAVEIAFASVGGALALKAGREGWLLHALRRTWGAGLLAAAAVVALGLAIDHWMPAADSLPQAVRLWQAGR